MRDILKIVGSMADISRFSFINGEWQGAVLQPKSTSLTSPRGLTLHPTRPAYHKPMRTAA